MSDTTNTVEGSVVKSEKLPTESVFCKDRSLRKLVHLATRNIKKKWTAPLHNWSLTFQQFYSKFGDRTSLNINANSAGASPRIKTSGKV